jgi:nucleotide-binding universal stress UspA family protein
MAAMLKRIVVPLDGSAFGEQALPMALSIAGRDHAELELVHVYDTLPPYYTQGAPVPDPRLDEDLRKDRASYLDAVARWLREQTAAPVTATILDGPVASALADHIAMRQADLVVMATHGRGGLSRAWLGSVASDLVRHASAPVMLIRPDASGSRAQPAPPFERVLIPLDGSPLSEEAVEHAVTVAGGAGVEYILIHVILPIVYVAADPISFAYPDEVALLAAAEAYLGEVADRLRARDVAATIQVLRHPQPARAILEYADERGADVIAVETHGRSGVTRLLMGSVADKVVRASPVPVLLHRPRRNAAPPTSQSRRPSQ